MIDYCEVYDCGPRPEVKMKQPGPYAMPVVLNRHSPGGALPRKKTPTNPEEEAELLRFVEDEVSEGEEEEELSPPPREDRRWKWRGGRGSHQSSRDRHYDRDAGCREMPP
ncbi:unnamed protein product [Merluccius merluccius]